MIDAASQAERAARVLSGTADAVSDEFVRSCDVGAFNLVLPGEGRTRTRLSQLRKLGHGDLAVARLGEGHADAMAILAEAGASAPTRSRFGVWAAGPINELRAIPIDGGWRLDGRRQWCSGALLVTHGLVTAATPDGDRLFLVPTSSAGFLADPGSWPAVGMAGSGTLDVTFDGVTLPDAATVGDPGFYLDRPGFWVGAIGVAAVWLGGAEVLASKLAKSAGQEPHALAHLGAVYARLASLRATLARASEVTDSLLQSGDSGDELELLARSVRAEIESGASEVLERTGRATGASALGHDGTHARRVADLTVYLRQSHAERDLEALGVLALRLGRADPTA